MVIKKALKLFKSNKTNNNMSELKQVILIRKDLKMSPGKIAAQAAHASVQATLSANKKLVSNWKKTGMKKIALKVNSLEELNKYYEKALQSDIVCSKISDAGHTEIKPGTTTCVAIGPGPEKKIDDITSELSPY